MCQNIRTTRLGQNLLVLRVYNAVEKDGDSKFAYHSLHMKTLNILLGNLALGQIIQLIMQFSALLTKSKEQLMKEISLVEYS